MSKPASTSWQPIPSRTLSRGGPRRRDGVLLLQAAALVALVGAGSWLGWSLVRPLSSVSAPAVAPMADAPEVTFSRGAMENRHALVTALSGDNIFAHDRKLWERDALAPQPDAAPIAQARAKHGDKARDAAPRVKESSDDARKVAELFALRQIYTRRDGQLVARLSLLKTPDPENSIPLVVDDEFKEAPGSDAVWTLTSIDRAANSVTIERGSQSATLSLFSASVRPLEAPSTVAEVPTVAAVDPQVQFRTRGEIVAELRAAKVTDADISSILALLDANPELLKPAAPQPAAVPAPVAGARTPPPGLEGVLRLMGQQHKKAAGAKPAEVDASSKAD